MKAMEKLQTEELIKVLKKNSEQAVIMQAANLALEADMTLEQFENTNRAAFLSRALQLEHGNQFQAAKRVHIHRNTLGREVERLKLGEFCQTTAAGKKPVKSTN